VVGKKRNLSGSFGQNATFENLPPTPNLVTALTELIIDTTHACLIADKLAGLSHIRQFYCLRNLF